MLRRLPLGFAGVIIAAIAIAACSSPDATETIAVGPSFAPQTLYAANVTQNAINIYAPSPKSTSGPQYQIGGGSTTIAGPQYLAFDSLSNLWVTNWLSSTSTGSLLEFKAQATGNVLPFQTWYLGDIRPRGIAATGYTFTGDTSPTRILAVGVVDPAELANYTSDVQFFEAASAVDGPYLIIGGPNTGLNVPSGLAFDKNSNLYVANEQGASVSVFAFPTASPTPSPSASTSPTASPTATASASATASPTPDDVTPAATLTSSELGEPTGVAVDSSGNIYVSDEAAKSSLCSPAPPCGAILVFAAAASGATPTAVIAGPKSLLVAPTDVQVDADKNIYVADSAGGTGVVYVFAAGAVGDVAPAAVLKSPGSLIGIGLTP